MLGKRLKLLREKKGLFQKDLANLLNISTSAYGYYEQGKRDPDTNTLQLLSEYYNVSIDYLLGKTNNSNPIGQSKKSQDIDEKLDDFIEEIKTADGLMFSGGPMDDQTKRILLKMLKNTKEMAEEMSKNKKK